MGMPCNYGDTLPAQPASSRDPTPTPQQEKTTRVSFPLWPEYPCWGVWITLGFPLCASGAGQVPMLGCVSKISEGEGGWRKRVDSCSDRDSSVQLRSTSTPLYSN